MGSIAGGIGSIAGGAAGSIGGGLLGGLSKGLGFGGGGGGGAVDMSGMPTAPQFNSLRDPKTGLLSSNLQENIGGPVALNTQGIEAIRQRALGTGPSAWAQLQMGQNAASAQTQRSQAAQNSAAAQAQARGQLAQHGGLMGGASERLAQNAGNQLMAGRQGINAAQSSQNLQTQLSDEQQKTQMLEQLPGQEAQVAGVGFQNQAMQGGQQQYNIGNALQDKYAQDQANQTAYQQQMQVWSAQKQAQAIQNAGGGKKG